MVALKHGLSWAPYFDCDTPKNRFCVRNLEDFSGETFEENFSVMIGTTRDEMLLEGIALG